MTRRKMHANGHIPFYVKTGKYPRSRKYSLSIFEFYFISAFIYQLQTRRNKRNIRRQVNPLPDDKILDWPKLK